jgi:acyl-CoA thioesterase-1
MVGFDTRTEYTLRDRDQNRLQYGYTGENPQSPAFESPSSIRHVILMLTRLFLLFFFAVVPLAAQVKVINEGFPGENTAELDSRLDDLLTQFQPNFVVLFAGANDALNEKKFLSTQESGDRLDAMTRRIRSHGAQVILVTIHDPDMTRLMARHKPQVYGNQPPLQRVKAVNAQILRVAKTEHTKLVQFATILSKAGGANSRLSTDGVHLTAAGYSLLAAAVRAQLPDHMPANTTVLCFGDSLTYGIGVRPTNGATETAATYPAQLRALFQ